MVGRQIPCKAPTQKDLEITAGVPPQLDDICAADATIGRRKRGEEREERTFARCISRGEKGAQIRA